MVSILMPVYWASATEVASAVNGFSLTAGSFVANSQVELANGLLVGGRIIHVFFLILLIIYFLFFIFYQIFFNLILFSANQMHF